MARPRIGAATAAIPAALSLLLMGGCSHYQIGIPLVPGLSLGLGATRDGSFSMGLNTGFGPLGAGVAVNNGGLVSGSAGVGVGVAAGPVGTGIGVGKSVVLHDPKTGAAAAPPAAPATTAADSAAPAPVTVTKAGITQAATGNTASAQPPAVRISRHPPTVANAAIAAGEAGTPGNPVAP